ncbi:MAG: hypothetical protein PHG63_00900 [Candidatus Dojkabacteria bacterium]|nr:hypothetical protein [Candidatus Dojkabacteria bacterium]
MDNAIPTQEPEVTSQTGTSSIEPKSSSKSGVYLLIVFLVILVIGLGGAVAYLLLSKGEDTDDTNDDNGGTVTQKCTYDGVVYDEGESFDATDGCNTCMCSDGKVSCTEMECVVDEEDDGGDEQVEVVQGETGYDSSLWEVYTNEEMGFSLKYPEAEVVVMRHVPDEVDADCVDVGPVDGEDRARISLGFLPSGNTSSDCFRTDLSEGNVEESITRMMIGGELEEGSKVVFTGDGSEESYINRRFTFDNVDENTGRTFAIEIEYYPEYEDEYWLMYQEILRTFEWN